jgi:hypothetical protein
VQRHQQQRRQHREGDQDDEVGAGVKPEQHDHESSGGHDRRPAEHCVSNALGDARLR